MRWALSLEYCGTGFSGWQIQPDQPSVQASLERALFEIAGHPIRVIAAGRTDTGVHASCQVVHFDTDVDRRQNAWLRGVNAFLPDSIAVLDARRVEDEFHARFSASGRHYRYLLLNRPIRPALLAGRMGWFHAPLDVDAMQAAAQLLLGEHDFSSFRAALCQAKSPVKQMYRLDTHRNGDVIVFDLHASAFLHHMVRNLVGCFVHIGKGNQPPEWILEVLAARNRSAAAPTFMPDGLYLTGVDYPEKFNIGAPRLPSFIL